MAMDRRYPWFVPIDLLMLPGCDQFESRRARSLADKICRRVAGIRAAWNRNTGEIYFYSPQGKDIGLQCGVGVAFMFKPVGASRVQPVTERDIDDMVDLIRNGMRSASEKDEAMEKESKREESDKRSLRERQAAAKEKDILKHADQIRKRKRGLQTVMATRG